MKKSEILFGALRLPIDFIAALSAFLLAYYLRPLTDLIPGVQYHFFPEQLPPFDDYTELAFLSATFLVLLFALGHLYSLQVTRRLTREIFQIIFWISAWLMFIIAYHFLIIHELFFSRIALAHIWFLTILFVVAGRVLFAALQSLLLHFGIGRRRVLLIGISDLADQFYKNLQSDRRYEVLGTLSSHPQSRPQEKLKIIGRFDQLESIVKKQGIEEIIQADPDATDAISSHLLAFCRSHQLKYHFIPDLVRLQRTNVDIQMVHNIPLISLKQTRLDGWGTIYKRFFDLGVSSILILILIPLWMLVPLLIQLDSRGPVIYKSRRKYRDQIFNVYKFRSMVAEADQLKKALLAQNERKGPLFKIKDDPRITRLGRFLRKTSLDELPQLLNVLLGSMSLVGPRPHLPEEVDQYQTHHYEVFALKPGLTGLAQTSGRSSLDFEEEVKLDTYYIENWSPWLDLKILLKTIAVVFRGDGH